MYSASHSVTECLAPPIEVEALTDKRQINLSYDDLWERLTLSQQFSAVSLGQFGYNLIFIRRINYSSVAVLQRADKIATITPDGIIKTATTMSLRR